MPDPLEAERGAEDRGALALALLRSLASADVLADDEGIAIGTVGGKVEINLRYDQAHRLVAALASVSASADRGLTEEEQDAYDWVTKRHEGCVECDEFCLPDRILLDALDRLAATPLSEGGETVPCCGCGCEESVPSPPPGEPESEKP
jgi:hypothetical protein